MSTFITLGNALQKFERFFDLILECDDLLPRPVIAQIGHNDCKKLPPDWNILTFVSMDDFQQHINDASVVLVHGGAGSIINCLEANKKPIVLSRLKKFKEHLDDHQSEFVKAMADKGFIYPVENIVEIKEVLLKTTEKFYFCSLL